MSKRIVIADDEPAITHVISLKLSGAGYDTVTAQDGEEAYAYCLEEPPALVVTDLQMPYMNGLELAKKLKENESTAGVSVIMLTARGFALEESEIAQTNIEQVLSKPFSPRDVLALVDRLTNEEGAEPGSKAA